MTPDMFGDVVVPAAVPHITLQRCLRIPLRWLPVSVPEHHTPLPTRFGDWIGGEVQSAIQSTSTESAASMPIRGPYISPPKFRFEPTGQHDVVRTVVAPVERSDV